MAKRFAVYKGLERPLVFKGFRGRFIYWGMSCLLLGLVLGAITMALINMWVGAVVLTGTMTGGLWFTASRQKSGLHRKTRASGIYVHRTHLQNISIYGAKERV